MDFNHHEGKDCLIHQYIPNTKHAIRYSQHLLKDWLTDWLHFLNCYIGDSSIIQSDKW